MSSGPAQTGTVEAAFIDGPAFRHPNKIAIVTLAESLSYGGLLRRSNQAANAIEALGCRRGDRVLLALPDSPDLVAALLGCAKLGTIAVPVSPFAAPDDYGHFVRDTEPSVAIVDAGALPAFEAASDGTPVRALTCGDTGERAVQQSWRRWCDAASSLFAPRALSADDPVVLFYTSGSAGLPKAAMHTHRSLLAAVRNVGDGVFGLCADDRVFSVPKLTFAFGFSFGMCFPLAQGATTILNARATRIEDVSALFAACRPTVIASVPSVLAGLLKASRSGTRLALSCTRVIASAGEPLPLSVNHGLREEYGVDVVDGIGSTEMATHYLSNRPGRAVAGSVGTAVPGCEVALRDDTGNAVHDGEIGTLWVRTESAFAGYWRRPSATATLIVDGWFNTRDHVQADGQGGFRYIGRADDMLKVGGLWVSPSDVETALCSHAAVDRAAVTTKPDATGVRRLVGYVVPVNGEPIDRLALVRHIAMRLPPHMMPSSLLVVRELPMTGNGKLNRRMLPTP